MDTFDKSKLGPVNGIFSVGDLGYSLWEIWDTHRERFGIFFVRYSTVGDLGYSPWEI